MFVENSQSTMGGYLAADRVLIVNCPQEGTVVDAGVEICMIEGIKKPTESIFANNEALSEKGKMLVLLTKKLLGLS